MPSRSHLHGGPSPPSPPSTPLPELHPNTNNNTNTNHKSYSSVLHFSSHDSMSSNSSSSVSSSSPIQSTVDFSSFSSSPTFFSLSSSISPHPTSSFDPTFKVSPAASICSTQVLNWTRLDVNFPLHHPLRTSFDMKLSALLSSSKVYGSVVIVAIILFQKFFLHCPNFLSGYSQGDLNYTFHTLITCLSLSGKLMEDQSLPISHWSAMSGISAQVLSSLELKIWRILNFDLLVSSGDYEECTQSLLKQVV